MDAAGDDMIDPKEAVVELEVIGYRFSLDNGQINYTYKKSDFPFPEFLEFRIECIKDHKSEIIEWLTKRSLSEIVSILCRIRKKTVEQCTKAKKEYGEDSTQAVSWDSYDQKIFSAYIKALLLIEREHHNHPGVDPLPLPTRLLL